MAGPTPALIALFNGYIAGTNGLHAQRLYTIALSGGLVLRFTDGDFDVLGNSTDAKVNGFTYSSQGVRVDQKDSKTQLHLKVGTDTDQWVVVLLPRPFDLVTGTPFPDTIGNIAFLQACQGGSLDAAGFQVDEAYFSSVPTWPMSPKGAVPVGCRTIFAGTVAEVDTTDIAAIVTVNDYRSLFTISMPRNFYQGQCRHTLFDSGCQLIASNYAINGTVSTVQSQSVIYANGLARPPGSGTYLLGRLVFTSGNNNGFQRTVKSWDGAFGLQLLNPLPFAVEVNDSFVIYPGCNKLLTTCSTFSNSVNFGGFSFIPPPEVQGG